MEEHQIRNAVIEKAVITNDEYGLLSAWLFLDYGDGSKQGFGGFALYLPKDFKHHGDCAGHFIWRVMEVAEVNEWSKLPGQTIRVQLDSGFGFNQKILSIGHIVKDIWFNPSEELKKNHG